MKLLLAVHPGYRTPLAASAGWICAALATLVAFAFLPALHFSLSVGLNVGLHSLEETLSVVVASLVFAFGTLGVMRGRASGLMVVASAFLGVAVLDFVHLLSFEGMPEFITSSGGGKAIVFFLAARLLAALAMLVMAFVPWRGVSGPWRVPVSALLLSFAAVVVVGGFAPVVRTWFFQPGHGLTPLKIGIEMLLVALYATAAGGFLLRMREHQAFPVVELFTAAAFMGASEACFAIYSRPTDHFNTLGHVFKVVAYLYVARAALLHVVLAPYTHLQRARAKLHASYDSFRELFHNSMDGVLVLDPDFAVLAANPAACKTLATPADKLHGASFRERVRSCHPPMADIAKQLAETSHAKAQMRLERRGGSTLDADVRLSTYHDGGGRNVISCVIRDVTERMRAERQLLRLNATLERRVSERTALLEVANRDLEAFAYSVAHDLRAPLAAINGFSQALAAEAHALLPRQLHYLERIRGASQWMSEMIDALLSLSRLGRTKLNPVEVDLAQYAEDTIENLRRAEPERMVEADIQHPLPVVGDAPLLHTVVQNLVGNAWKFSRRRSPAFIQVGSQQEEQGTVFFVRDNGEGFDMAYAKDLFNLFRRLHSQKDFSGHGIGLVNVRRIVELHGGRVWAQSAPGAGATFYFTLPPSRVDAGDSTPWTDSTDTETEPFVPRTVPTPLETSLGNG